MEVATFTKNCKVNHFYCHGVDILIGKTDSPCSEENCLSAMRRNEVTSGQCNAHEYTKLLGFITIPSQNPGSNPTL